LSEKRGANNFKKKPRKKSKKRDRGRSLSTIYGEKKRATTVPKKGGPTDQKGKNPHRQKHSH